jgi:GNAT superfamily N-acetyltransferase
MANPLIRSAGPDDVEALAGLNAEVQEIHFASRPDQFKLAQASELAQWFAQLLQNPAAKLWVAEVDGGLVGYAVALVRESPESPFCRARKWWNIDQLGVQATHRRAGIGRALVRQVASEARSQGIRDLELSSWAFNHDAQVAFSAFGFVPKVIRFELRTPESILGPASKDLTPVS